MDARAAGSLLVLVLLGRRGLGARGRGLRHGIEPGFRV
jgi:hypothetical protein